MSSMQDETPRSLKGNLLNARDRLGETIIEIVAADVAAHGPEIVGDAVALLQGRDRQGVRDADPKTPSSLTSHKPA